MAPEFRPTAASPPPGPRRGGLVERGDSCPERGVRAPVTPPLPATSSCIASACPGRGGAGMCGRARPLNPPSGNQPSSIASLTLRWGCASSWGCPCPRNSPDDISPAGLVLCSRLPKPHLGPCEPAWAPQPPQSPHYPSSSPSSGPCGLLTLLNTPIIPFLAALFCAITTPSQGWGEPLPAAATSVTKSPPGHGLASTDTLGHRTCTEHTMKPLRGLMASHWGPST